MAVPSSRLRRPVLTLAAVGGLHLVVYYIVTRANAAAPSTLLWNTRVAVDDLIPHLPWTWPTYWLPYLVLPLGVGRILGGQAEGDYRRTVIAFTGMILVGGIIQILFPARAPWPAEPAPSQVAFHQSALILPFATLPSMHVAYVTLGAIVIGTVWSGVMVRLALAGFAGAVAVGTLTLKEHVILDAVTGALLGCLTGWWWRRRLVFRLPP